MLAQARVENAHDEYVECNFLEFSTDRRFDVVVLSQVVEHFTKADGLKALDRAEQLASKLVYVSTPNGFLEQPELDGNPHQKHLSGWTVNDFDKLGYEVFGTGIKGLRGPVGKPVFGLEKLVRLLERLTRWYAYRHPQSAFGLSAVKRLHNGS
jgi:2-polyprenyl-3-methyl-5-hydroxy-6-metoxy-1,4-benzoquinol methylase